jgi:hypothetical protein
MNPFRYSEPVPVEDLMNRDAEAKELLERADEGNNSRLVAPRRFGKTSLLRRVIHDADREGWATVYVDFFGVLTAADVAQRIERAYAEQQGRLAHTFVVFDEFQEVLAAGDGIDATIRSEIQHHGDAAGYIFAGSHVGMMRQLFADRRRAFYGQAAPVELPPLPPVEVADYIAIRFQRTKRDISQALEPLLELAQGHPQRTMLLAHAVWELTPAGKTATEETWLAARERAMHQVRDELRTVWSALPTSHRRTLTAIAENTTPLYAAGRRHGGSRGGAISSATTALEDQGEITKDPHTPTGYRLTDPLLAAWITDNPPRQDA